MENESVVKYNSKLFAEIYMCDSLSEGTICEKVKECLRLGADVNAVDKNNAENTVLHVAVRKRCKSLVRFLLDSGAKADIRNERGLTAFELAKQFCDGDITELFEKHSQHNDFISDDQFSSTCLLGGKSSVRLDLNLDDVLWIALSAVPKKPYIFIDNRSNGCLLLTERFYKTIEEFENVILIDILVGEKLVIDDEIVLSHLRTIRNPIIIQCRSLSSAKVYFKEFQRDPELFDLNSELMEVDEDVIFTRLKDKDVFGIRVILESFMLNETGKFRDDQHRSLFDIHLFDNSFGLMYYAVKHDHLLAVRFLRLDIYNVKCNLYVHSLEPMSREMLAALLKVDFPIPKGNIELPKDVIYDFIRFKDELFKHAAYNGRQDIMEFLIQCTSEIDYKNLIKSFMERKRYIIVLEITKAGGFYPDNFNSSDINVSIPGGQEFVDFCRQRNQLHDLIVNSTLANVEEHFSDMCKSKSYLNTKNESAVATALRNKKFVIYGYLWSQGVCFKNDQEKRMIDQLNYDDKFHLREHMIPFFSHVGEPFIDYLLSKTRLPQFQLGAVNKERIRRYYERLNKIPEISIVLAVVQYSDYLDIIFDFDSERTVEIDPMASNNEGIYYPALGRIYIGAKLDEKRLLGVIAHELTHLAMQLVYKNSCKPYFRADIVEELAFKKLVAGASKLSHDSVIGLVFNPDCYEAEARAAELIVRVNHVVAMYGWENGKAKLKNQVPHLLEYYLSKVIPQFQRFVFESYLIKKKEALKQLNTDYGITKQVNNSLLKFKSRVNLKQFLQNAEKRVLYFVSSNTWWIATQICQHFKEVNLNESEFTFLKVDELLNFKCGSTNTPHVFIITVSSKFEVDREANMVIDWVKRISENPLTKFVFIMSAKRVGLIKCMRLQRVAPKEAVETKTDEHLELESFLSSKNQLFICTSKIPRLSTISIYQLLNTWLCSYENSIVVLKFEDFVKTYNVYKQVLICDACKIIVLESTSHSNRMVSEVRDLFSQTVVPSGKKFIVVTPIRMDCLINPGLQHYKNMHSVSMNDLNVDSSELLDHDVSFQGKMIKMSELIKPFSYDVIDDETLLKLANKEAIDISVCKELPVNETLYVPRTLRYKAKMNGQWVKKHLRKGKPLASDIAVYYEENCVKVNHLDSTNEKQFDEFCEQHPEIDVHWLKRKDNDFIWKKSKSATPESFTLFRKNVDKRKKEDVSEASLVDELDEHQLVIVSAKAGMGKTTLLTHIAQLLKDRHPSTWIIQVNLNVCTKVLDEEAKRPSFQAEEMAKALNFFVNKLLDSRNETKLKTNFEKVLIRQFIKMSGSIVILFDAFDELVAKQRDVVIKLIKSLQKTKVKQMWVTTRPYRKARIEKGLLQISHTLIPFTKKGQIQFLNAFWMQNLTNETKVKKFATALMNQFTRRIGDKERKFTGIPLQTIMLAEAFEQECTKFHNSTIKRPCVRNKFDETDLYKHFIKRKFSICQFIKSGLEKSTLLAGSNRKKWYLEFLKDHQFLALCTLFDEEQRDILLGNDEIRVTDNIEEMTDNICAYGIVNKIIDGKPQFIHRTFAEYFTAKFIVDRLIKHRSEEVFIRFVLCKILIKRHWKVVRTFINMQLSKVKDNCANLSQHVRSLVMSLDLNQWKLLRIATEESNLNIFKFVLDEIKDADCCNVECDGAAELFHTAIKICCLKVTKALLKMGFNVNYEYVSIEGDGEYCRTPLCEAVMHGKADICKWLLKNGADCNTRLEPMHNYCPFGREWYYKWDGCTALHVACMYRRKNVVSTLLARSTDVNSTDEYQMTPLHVAAICGYLKIVETLIKNKADVNAVNVGGYTPLCEAIRWQRKKVVECLVNLEGVDVNGTNGSGVTPLHVAAVYGNGEIVQILLERDANIDTLVDLDETPTADVSSWHITEFITKACHYSASITPLYLARVSGNDDVAAILSDNGAAETKTVLLLKYHHNIFSDRSVIQYLKEKKISQNGNNSGRFL